MSLGGTGFDQGTANAVASAWATGNIVLVAAAGNIRSIDQGGQLFYPAALSNVIGVSGVRTDKTFASSSPCPHPQGGTVASNHGTHVDLAAPFWALSTVGTSNYEDENQGWCGTSMATPHVSGTAALVWAKNPGWSNQQVVNRLLSTAEDQGASGWDNLFGYGIVDAAEAVGVAPDPPPDPLFDVFISGTPDIAPQAWCEWSAHPSGGAPPYSYAWTVRYVGTVIDQPVGDGSNLLQYTNEGSSFLIKVTVTDQNNHTAFTEHPVNVAQGMGCT